MTLRPYGIVASGRLEIGLELVLDGRTVVEIRPHTGIPEPFVVSVPFVNAHSHLEYRGLQGAIEEREYWPWIRELTRRKALQSPEEVGRDTRLAASENSRAGVGLIGEHSDRPFSGAALMEAGIGGVIFQETITFFERESPAEKLESVARAAKENIKGFGGSVYPSPHAIYTVDRATLEGFGRSTDPISLHLAETAMESQFTRDGTGPIAEFYKAHGCPIAPTGKSAFETASDLGLVRKGAQLVHCCDISTNDALTIAKVGATVAHCPRSNLALGCPAAPIREMLDAGIQVGLGMDSPASGGPIDMFAEMRAAIVVSLGRVKAVTAEEVWNMATAMGARSLGFDGWDLVPGYEGRMIRLNVEGALGTEGLIERGSPDRVEWIG